VVAWTVENAGEISDLAQRRVSQSEAQAAGGWLQAGKEQGAGAMGTPRACTFLLGGEFSKSGPRVRSGLRAL